MAKGRGPDGQAIPFSPKEAGWLPIPGSVAHTSWLMVTSKLWAAPSRQHKPPWDPRFPAVDPAWGPQGPLAGGARCGH